MTTPIINNRITRITRITSSFVKLVKNPRQIYDYWLDYNVQKVGCMKCNTTIIIYKDLSTICLELANMIISTIKKEVS